MTGYALKADIARRDATDSMTNPAAPARQSEYHPVIGKAGYQPASAQQSDGSLYWEPVYQPGLALPSVNGDLSVTSHCRPLLSSSFDADGTQGQCMNQLVPRLPNPDLSARPVNKLAVAAAFSRAAPDYDRFADLQRYAGERLLAQLGSLAMPCVLDAGCGTGWFSRRWREAGCEVTALDLSSAMLAHVRTHDAVAHNVMGDIEALPLADARFDLAWSNLAVQWCSQLAHGLAELYRITRPGGCIAFSTLGAHSLHELHTAWCAVDVRPHANRFLKRDAIAAACPGSALCVAR